MTALLRDTQLDDKQAACVNTISTSGEILSSLIADILDYSKIEAGVLEVEDVDFLVDTLIHDVMTLMLPAASLKGLDLRSSIAPNLAKTVRGDFNKLRQILLNLVNNAVKFTESGSIEVHAEPNGNWLSLSVKDSGIGISESGQTRLFNDFVQVDSFASRRSGGTGLGLAICRKLATALDGEIGVDSKVNQGSTFWVKVPLRVSDCEAVIHANHFVEQLATFNILVVEDNEINRAVACGLLEREGHRVSWVGTGNEALACLEHTMFDAILMDLNLPGLSGLESIRLIRAHHNPNIARIPVIVVSALVTKDDIEDSLSAGANAFLGKPYRPDRFKATLHATVRRTVHGDELKRPKIVNQSAEVQLDFQLDQQQLYEHVSDLGLEMTSRIVDLFTETVPDILVNARQEFDNRNTKNLIRAAHRIKSSAATLGLLNIADLAGALESTTAKSCDERAEKLITQLEHSLPETIESLQTAMDTMRRSSLIA
jgi:CheY-like chemotaxis protein